MMVLAFFLAGLVGSIGIIYTVERLICSPPPLLKATYFHQRSDFANPGQTK
jgi:hypothetical protein